MTMRVTFEENNKTIAGKTNEITFARVLVIAQYFYIYSVNKYSLLGCNYVIFFIHYAYY